MSVTTHITVTVSRTVQIKQYEPVTITIAETAELDDKDDPSKVKEQLYKSISPKVTKYINNQIDIVSNTE